MAKNKKSDFSNSSKSCPDKNKNGKGRVTLSSIYKNLASNAEKFYIEKNCKVVNGTQVFSDPEDPRFFVLFKDKKYLMEIDEGAFFQNYLRKFLFENYYLPLDKKRGEFLYGMLKGQALGENNAVIPIQRTVRIGDVIYYNPQSPDARIVAISKKGIFLENHRFIKPVFQRKAADNSHFDMSASPKDLIPLLEKIFNFSHEDLLILAVYIVSLFAGNKNANVIIALSGPPGVGKSTAASDIIGIHNPLDGRSSLQSVPKKTSDLALICNHFDSIALDNSGTISSDNSNLLCQAISGGCYSYRLLYSSTQIVSLDVSSNIIITSVSDVIQKDDLISRTMRITPLKLDGGKREEIGKHRAKVDKIKPKIIGAVFKILKSYLEIENKKHIDVPDGVRLGTLYEFALSIAPIIGVTEEEMSTAFIHNQMDNYQNIASEDLVISELSDMVIGNGGTYVASVHEILSVLDKKFRLTGRAKSLPENESVLSRRIFENVNMFKSMEIDIERCFHKGKRAIRFKYIGDPAVLKNMASATNAEEAEKDDSDFAGL